MTVYQPLSWRKINKAGTQQEPFLNRPVAAEAFKEGKCCDLRGLRGRGFGVTRIVGDTYGLLADIYFRCQCGLLFKVHVKEESVLAEFKATPQNRHGEIRSA